MNDLPIERLTRLEAARYAARCLRRIVPVVFANNNQFRTSAMKALESFPNSKGVVGLFEDPGQARVAEAIREVFALAADGMAEPQPGPGIPAPPAVRLMTQLELSTAALRLLLSHSDREALSAIQSRELNELSKRTISIDRLEAMPLWPDGLPLGWPAVAKDTHEQLPRIVIAWDAEAVSPEEYKALVLALGDLVRSHGGIGIQRVDARGYEVPVSQEVPV